MKKLGWLVAAIAPLAVSTAAIAQTRGEAYLEYVWANMPAGTGLYELGNLNSLGRNQANETLINQGVEWCTRAENPSILEISITGLFQEAIATEMAPETELQFTVADAAIAILCPDKLNVYQQAAENAANTAFR